MRRAKDGHAAPRSAIVTHAAEPAEAITSKDVFAIIFGATRRAYDACSFRAPPRRDYDIEQHLHDSVNK